MRLYVTNLRSEVTDNDLRKLFETHGKVVAAEIVKTLTSNEPTGLGIVEMDSPSDVSTVRKELDGKLLKGNSIKIFDRRITSNRRERTDRRELDIPRDSVDRRQKERRQNLSQEKLVRMFDELERREIGERRASDQRNLGERRIGDRRSGLD